METNNQSQQRTWNLLTSFLQNPIINLIVGILVTILFFYLVERKEIDTKFAVDNIELIAAQTLDAPELELYWDKEKINDISSVKIAFWNSGKQFLSMENVSTTNPMRIVVPKGVRVLFAEVIETSRPALKFSTTYSQENLSTEGIVIKILDDEAIEYMDGGVIKILFTGTPEDDFYITGRILGNANGFKKTRWENSVAWELIISLVALFIQGIYLFNSLRKSQDKRFIRKFMLATSVLMIIMAVVGSIYFFKDNAFIFPNWVH